MHIVIIQRLLLEARKQGYRTKRIGGSVELSKNGEFICLAPMCKEGTWDKTVLWNRLRRHQQMEAEFENYCRSV